MYQFGAFPTESSGHVSEYVPYFRTHPDVVAAWKGKEYIGESGFYAHNWPTWRRENDRMLRDVLNGSQDFQMERGGEYPSHVVEAIQTGRPTTIYVSTPNHSWVDNLHDGNVVEVAANVDSNGIHPQPFGRLPEHMASLVRRHQEFNDLAVTSILEEDREAAVHALMLAAQLEYLPAYLH
jgi:alpha-galactosidase